MKVVRAQLGLLLYSNLYFGLDNENFPKASSIARN